MNKARRWNATLLAAGLLTLAATQASAQLSAPADTAPSPFRDPVYSPDTKILYDLEAKFAAEVAKGGGAAYGSWFADDAVALQENKAPVTGKTALAAQSNWDPKQYELTWKPDGARLSPAGDMGFTWGSYQGRFRDHEGSWQIQTGRYITVWKKNADGVWRVELDASNNGPPDAGSCCSLR